MWGGSKPKRDSGRLHGLATDRQQLGREGVQVHLVAKLGGKRLDGSHGVIPAAVEVAIRGLLDAMADRPEQGSNG